MPVDLIYHHKHSTDFQMTPNPLICVTSHKTSYGTTSQSTKSTDHTQRTEFNA